MTKNEKLIITLLKKNNALSKREFEAKGRMSWATVVKMVTRLEEAGYIQESGLQERNNVKGKNASLYELASRNPLVVGIDIEEDRSSFILTNLMGDRIREYVFPNTHFNEVEDVAVFIQVHLNKFLGKMKISELYGVGVGIPLFICHSEGNLFLNLQAKLEKKLGILVRVDNVIRAYVMERERILSHKRNILYVTIRTGIGLGLFLDGKIFQGDNLLSGEISHIKIADNEQICSCGKKGCLITMVNEKLLHHQYLEKINPGDDSDCYDALADLFRRCSLGENSAEAIVADAMANLSKALIPILLVLDVSKIIVSGHFNSEGEALLPYLTKELEENLPIRRNLEINYEPIAPESFLNGAALLILSDFLII